MSSTTKSKPVSPFLAGNYGPVAREHSKVTLTPSFGKVPSALLGGQYIRNGPNAAAPPRTALHWFDSDGMLHGVHMQDSDGAEATYTNRFVRTDVMQAGLSLGFPVVPSIALFLNVMGFKQIFEFACKAFLMPFYVRKPMNVNSTTANTNLVFHGGKLLALQEGCAPVEIAVPSLVTIGSYDYQGKVLTFTAHPKIDPDTNEMFFFGYDVNKPRIVYYHANAKDELLVYQKDIALRRPAMHHDWAVTSTSCVLIDHPLFFQVPGTFKHLEPQYRPAREPGMTTDPILFYDSTSATRIGVFPKSDPDNISWFEVEGCAVIHTANAWDEEFVDDQGKTHKLTVLVAPRMKGGLDLRGLSERQTVRETTAILHIWVLDHTTGEVFERSFEKEANAGGIFECEFPTIDNRRAGKRVNQVYAAKIGTENAGIMGFDGMVKYTFDWSGGNALDLAKGKTSGPVVKSLTYGLGKRGGEPVFVPRDGNAKNADEDDGYLVTFVHEEKQDEQGEEIGTTELWIVDAKTMEVVCKLPTPQRVPYGFHGTWVDAAQVEMQKLVYSPAVLSGEVQPLLDADKERKDSWIRWLLGF